MASSPAAPSRRDPSELIKRVRAGHLVALSRALTVVTNETAGHEELSKAFFAEHGRSHKIGLCGAPGSGKSSLVNRLVAAYRKAGKTVGVLAVDPTSPYTGGAFLGDRLRVQEHALDDGVFMRSLATRGAMGGFNATIFAAIHALEAFGFDVILLETVGTGQDEVDVADVADTVVCVTAPYQGDEFQAMKAGAMEIADLFAVNKADLEEVQRTVAALRDALSLGPDLAEGWQPQVQAVSAATGKGLPELLTILDEHRTHLEESGELEERHRRQLRRELALLISKKIFEDAARRISDKHIDQLLAKKATPAALGAEIIGSSK
jgi:LAO/AO transport system kinase